MTIGQLSKQTEISVETIRYYESIGLLPVPKKRESGYRNYSRNYISLVEFIKRAKKLDFTLSEIKEMFSSAECENFCDLTQSKLDEVKKKIEYYKELEKRLSRLVNSCETDSLNGCAVITSLGAPVQVELPEKHLRNRKE